MADGAKFDIAIETHSMGADSSAAQLNALAAQLQHVDAVATQFDTVVAAASKRLEEASVAAQLAATELGAAEKRYGELEGAALRSAKAVEKAAAAGKDTAALKVAAESAAAAMRAQGKIVDDLGGKSRAAAAEQARLSATFKTLQQRQAAAAAEAKKAKPAVDGMGKALSDVGAGGAIDRLKSTAGNFSTVGGAAVMAAAAGVAVATAFVGAAVSMGKFALASRPDAVMRLTLASQRLQLSFQRLFLGLKLDKFLGAIDRMGALFDTTNTSGRALKLLIETIFQPLIDAVVKVEPYVSEMFKGMIHGVLRVVIAILTIRNAIFRSLSPETRAAIKAVADKVFTLENAFKVGTVAGIAVAGALGLVALALVGVGVSLLVAMVPFLLFWAAVAGAYLAIKNFGKVGDWFKEKWTAIGKWFGTLAESAVTWGSDIVDGLWEGIKDAWRGMLKEFKLLVDKLPAAIKKVLGIASPSKVMMELGGYTVEGFTQAIEAGATDVHEAGIALGDAVTVGASGGVSTSTSTTSSRANVTININAPSGDAGDIAAQVRRVLIEVLEGVSVSIGGGEVPA